MAKEIRWSVRADQERLDILQYWTNRNKSISFSLKLGELFREAVDLISYSPESGKPTQHPLVRIKIVRDYLIYYHVGDTYIQIITIWDSRRNPKKFKL